MPMSRVSVGGGFVVSDYFDVAGKTTVFSCSRFVIISCEIKFGWIYRSLKPPPTSVVSFCTTPRAKRNTVSTRGPRIVPNISSIHYRGVFILGSVLTGSCTVMRFLDFHR